MQCWIFISHYQPDVTVIRIFYEVAVFTNSYDITYTNSYEVFAKSSCTIRMNLYKWPTPNPAPKPTHQWVRLYKFVRNNQLVKYVRIGREIALTITPVFSVTWYFRNHSDLLTIWWLIISVGNSGAALYIYICICLYFGTRISTWKVKNNCLFKIKMSLLVTFYQLNTFR